MNMSNSPGEGGCSEEDESLGGTTNEDDEYHEDGLPDLVLENLPPSSGAGARHQQQQQQQQRFSESSQNSGSLGSLDLLTLVGSQGRLNLGSGGCSTSDLLLASNEDHYNEAEYAPNGANEEILTEVSNKGVFKVSYVDHR